MELIFWLGPLVVSKTTCRTTNWISPNSNMSFWMKWTKCWTWALQSRLKKFWRHHIRKVRFVWASVFSPHVCEIKVDDCVLKGARANSSLCVCFSPDSDSNPQTLLFSATCPPWVYEVAKKYMRPECKHVDLVGKKTQRAATTVEVSGKCACYLLTLKITENVK